MAGPAGMALDADLAALGRRLRESTVEVHGADGAIGAGVVWTESGLVVTNAHVVRRSSRVVDVRGRVLTARLVGWDPERDLAALAIGAPAGLVPAQLGDPDRLRVGDLLMAMGHPGGLRGALTLGIVHALEVSGRPPGRRLIQADLQLAPGNSGGPMADARGRVVGVSSMVAGGLAVAIAGSVVARFVAGLPRRAATPA